MHVKINLSYSKIQLSTNLIKLAENLKEFTYIRSLTLQLDKNNLG